MKTVEKVWVNSKNADQISVMIREKSKAQVTSLSLAAQGFQKEFDEKVAVLSVKREVFEKEFPGVEIAASSETAPVLNMPKEKIFGVPYKLVRRYTTDSALASEEYYRPVVRPSDGSTCTVHGAVVYQKTEITVDMTAMDDPRPVYDSVNVVTPIPAANVTA